MSNFLLDPMIIPFGVGMTIPSEHSSLQSSDSRFIKTRYWLFDFSNSSYFSDFPCLNLFFLRMLRVLRILFSHLTCNFPHNFGSSSDLFDPEKCSVLFFLKKNL